MIWTDAHRDLLRQFAAKFPLVPGEDNCRAWTAKLASQFHYSFGPAWGHKRADAGRPVSKDSIAYQGPEGFLGFDVISGAGTPSPTLVPNPGVNDLTGQVFVPVPATNYVDGPVPPPVPVPDHPAPPVDLGPLTHAIEVLGLSVAELKATVAGQRAELDAARDELSALHNRVEAHAHPWPTQTSRTWGHSHTVGG